VQLQPRPQPLPQLRRAHRATAAATRQRPRARRRRACADLPPPARLQVLPALMNEYRTPELNVQNGVLKSLSFMFEYIGEMGKDYINAVAPLLQDALMDRDLVHRWGGRWEWAPGGAPAAGGASALARLHAGLCKRAGGSLRAAAAAPAVRGWSWRLLQLALGAMRIRAGPDSLLPSPPPPALSPHRQTAASVVQHISLGVAGLGCEPALLHLLNYVSPRTAPSAHPSPTLAQQQLPTPSARSLVCMPPAVSTRSQPAYSSAPPAPPQRPLRPAASTQTLSLPTRPPPPPGLRAQVWPNIFESSPHVVQAVTGAIDGCRLALGPSVVLHYLLQVRRPGLAGRQAAADAVGARHCLCCWRAAALVWRCGMPISSITLPHIAITSYYLAAMQWRPVPQHAPARRGAVPASPRQA
jgi:hypothetical protein